eukprot:2344467-Prymnesium_polylepis.1
MHSEGTGGVPWGRLLVVRQIVSPRHTRHTRHTPSHPVTPRRCQHISLQYADGHLHTRCRLRW